MVRGLGLIGWGILITFTPSLTSECEPNCLDNFTQLQQLLLCSTTARNKHRPGRKKAWRGRKPNSLIGQDRKWKSAKRLHLYQNMICIIGHISISTCTSSPLHICLQDTFRLFLCLPLLLQFCAVRLFFFYPQYTALYVTSSSWLTRKSVYISRCKQTTPGFTCKWTETPIFRWTRVCLVGPHQSSDECSRLPKQSWLSEETNSGPSKADQKALVWKRPNSHFGFFLTLITIPDVWIHYIQHDSMFGGAVWPCVHSIKEYSPLKMIISSPIDSSLLYRFTSWCWRHQIICPKHPS